MNDVFKNRVNRYFSRSFKEDDRGLTGLLQPLLSRASVIFKDRLENLTPDSFGESLPFTVNGCLEDLSLIADFVGDEKIPCQMVLVLQGHVEGMDFFTHSGVQAFFGFLKGPPFKLVLWGRCLKLKGQNRSQKDQSDRKKQDL